MTPTEEIDVWLLSDRPQASKIMARWYYDEWLTDVKGVTAEQVNEKVLQAASASPLPAALLGYINHELIGAVELKLHENKHYPDYEHWLGGVYVKPSHRGLGVASKLITQAIAYARKSGVVKLYLQCESHNEALYKQHGFKVLHSGRHRVPVSIMMIVINK